MKSFLRVLLSALAITILTQGCQTETELTDSDKAAIMQAVKQTSQDFWATMGETRNNESFSKVKEYYDENSDIIWQTDPVALILNTAITIKQADWLAQLEKIIEDRISTTVKVSEAYYSVLSDEKVLEVIKGETSYMKKDSSAFGPFTFVGTTVWANINGEWRVQFTQQVNK